MEYAKQFLLTSKLAMEKQKRLIVNLDREGKFIDLEKIEEKDIFVVSPDGTIEIKDPEKLDELLKSLEERLEEAKDKRVVDTAVVGIKPEDGDSEKSEPDER